MRKKTIPPIPDNELDRILSILNYEILDTANDEELDLLTKLTANIFNVPVALITIVDDKRQWFKSHFGWDIRETERCISFCQYTILSDEIFELEDALNDERFAGNALVHEPPYLRSYCGAPLINLDGFRMGSLALIDYVPRKYEEQEKKVLKLLAQQVVNHFELHSRKKALEEKKDQLEQRVHERTMELEEKINELNRKDEKLNILNKELNQFIYKASHDLVGPLKTMQGLTNIALNEVKEDNIKDYLQLLHNTEKKLDKTLGSLLKIVVIKEISDVTEIKWDTLIEGAFEAGTKRIPRKNFDLQLTLKTEKNFRSDSTLLCIILEELFVNGLQYNRSDKPRITVSVDNVVDDAQITISDNGIGIRDEDKDKVFEMFYKTFQSTGSGLGLYIVRKALEKLKGTISFDSNKNHGTTFTLNIPNQR